MADEQKIAEQRPAEQPAPVPVQPPAAPPEKPVEAPKPAEQPPVEAPRPAVVPPPAAPAEEMEETMPPEPEVPTRKFNLPLIFGRYTFDGVTIKDPGLKKYININAIAIPHTMGKNSNRPFSKQKVNIVERLINGMMRTEHATGEKARCYRMVKEAFLIIENKTHLNPIQVLVDAIERSSPREEVTRLKYGGISVPKAVDTSSYRRVCIALKFITQGVVRSSHGNRKRIQDCLADELVAAAKGDVNSFAMSKKGEIERVAASAR